MKRYLSVKQVVERLNHSVSIKQIYALIQRGKLKVNRELGKILVEEDSLEALLDPRPQVAPDVSPVPADVTPLPKLRRSRKRRVKQTVALW